MNVFTFIAIKKKFKILIQTNVQALPGIWRIYWPGRAFDKYPDQAWLTGSLGVAGCLSLNLPWVTGCWALVGDPQWPCQPWSTLTLLLLSNHLHSVHCCQIICIHSPSTSLSKVLWPKVFFLVTWWQWGTFLLEQRAVWRACSRKTIEIFWLRVSLGKQYFYLLQTSRGQIKSMTKMGFTIYLLHDRLSLGFRIYLLHKFLFTCHSLIFAFSCGMWI